MLSGTAGDIQFILLVIMIAMLLHSGPKFLAFAWGGVVKVTQAAIGVLGTILIAIATLSAKNYIYNDTYSLFVMSFIPFLIMTAAMKFFVLDIEEARFRAIPYCLAMVAFFTALCATIPNTEYYQDRHEAAGQIMTASMFEDAVTSRVGPVEIKDLPDLLDDELQTYLGKEVSEARLIMLVQPSAFENKAKRAVGLICPKRNSWGTPLLVDFSLPDNEVEIAKFTAFPFFCEHAVK